MSPQGGLLMYSYVNKEAVVISTSVFCALTILANLFMIRTILASSKLRTSPKHILILALGLADFYSGVFELPLLAEYYAVERLTHDLNMFRYMSNGGIHVVMSLRMMLVISICAISILSMLTRHKGILMMFSVSMIIASVGYSLVIVLPVTEGLPEVSGSCYLSAHIAKTIALSIGGFFSKALVMIVLAVDIAIMHCGFSRSLPMFSDEERRSFPFDVILACVLMLVFYIPFRIIRTYYPGCRDHSYECNTMHIVLRVTSQWEFVRTCIMPFVWLLCRETRRSIKQVCCCRCEPPSNQPGYIRDMGQYQTPNQPGYPRDMGQYQTPNQPGYPRDMGQYQTQNQPGYPRDMGQYQTPNQPGYTRDMGQYQTPNQPGYTQEIRYVQTPHQQRVISSKM